MSRDLNDLHPAFRSMADAALAAWAADGIDILVTCTERSEADQALLYAQGRTAPGRVVTDAKPGYSAHNYGLGLDVVPIINGKPDWDGNHPIWNRMGELAQAQGLVWLGAPGSPFPEKPHFQHPDWRRVAGVLS